jgi:Protein kinase domain
MNAHLHAMAQPLRFAHFEVLTRSDGSPHVLGQGAMGATYKALDQILLSLAVIKVLAPELQAVPSARQRFLQEAQMMERLRHPHVANVFFFGDSSSGAFYAMDFCEGPNLNEYVSQFGPLDWHDAFRLALQAADALHALDEHDLVHRNLKPSNIMLTKDTAGNAHLKLIDFGAAREGLPSYRLRLKQAGFTGTPAYASPEQFLETSDLDSRSDLYSLGVVLWFCLTGKPPFRGTQSEVMFHHVNSEPDWKKLPAMPKAALSLLKRMLAKSANERPSSPAALFKELQTLLGGTIAGGMHLRATEKIEGGGLGDMAPATIDQDRTLLSGERVLAIPESAEMKLDVSAVHSSAGDAAVARPALIFWLRELEQRRAQLEAEGLKTEKRIEIEREWLSREREVLEKDRLEFAARESERALRIAEEQERIEEQRRALAQQQALLEEKREEQHRLEREIQVRVQMQFQKLQEEARDRETQWQRRRAAGEEALHQSEADFRAREQENLARLEALKSEAASLEARVRADSLFLNNAELEQNRRNQQEEAVGDLAEETLAAEERRLDELRKDLNVRLAQWQQAQKKRVLTLSIGTLLAVLLAGIAAFYIKGRVVDFRSVPGHEQWQVALKERDRAKAERRWSDLLNWCVTTNESLRAKPEFAETLKQHQSELAGDAASAIAGLLEMNTLPDASAEAGHKLLFNVEKTREWNLPADRLLLLAKLRMPEASARGAGAEALQAYLDATNADPSFAAKLRGELQLTIQRLREQLRSGKMETSGALLHMLKEIAKSESKLDWSEAERLRSELLAEEARRNGHPEEGLRLLLDTVRTNPAWTESLRPQAAEMIAQIATLPMPSILPMVGDLRSASDTWKIPDAYIVLAGFETDENVRLDYYKQADNFGSIKARALVGRALLNTGVRQNNPVLIQEGEAKLREAIAAGDTEAMVHLGEALYGGRGIPENADEALKLAKMAESQGHPDAFYLAARAQLRLAEIARDPNQFAEAATNLEKAVAKNLPGAAYFLYIALYNDSVKDSARAVAALEKGVAAHDKNCLFRLGLWYIAGQPPAAQNITRGRALIKDAASLSNEQAKEWLRKHPL